MALLASASPTGSSPRPAESGLLAGCKGCPVKVRFRKNGPDFFALQAVLDLPETFDPRASAFGMALENTASVLYSATL